MNTVQVAPRAIHPRRHELYYESGGPVVRTEYPPSDATRVEPLPVGQHEACSPAGFREPRSVPGRVDNAPSLRHCADRLPDGSAAEDAPAANPPGARVCGNVRGSALVARGALAVGDA